MCKHQPSVEIMQNTFLRLWQRVSFGSIIPYLYCFIQLEMMAKKAEQEPRPGPGAGRRTGRNQLRVEGVQDFNPAGGSAVRLSRASEKQVADDKKKGGCCGGKKD